MVLYNSILNAALLIIILNIQLLGGTMNKQNFSQKKYVESRNLLTWWQTNGVLSFKQINVKSMHPGITLKNMQKINRLTLLIWAKLQFMLAFN